MLLLMVLSSGSFHMCNTGNRRGVGHNSLDPKPQHVRAQSVPVLPQLHVLQLLQSLYFCHILVMKPLQLRADRQQTDVTVQPQHAGWWVGRCKSRGSSRGDIEEATGRGWLRQIKQRQQQRRQPPTYSHTSSSSSRTSNRTADAQSILQGTRVPINNIIAVEETHRLFCTLALVLAAVFEGGFYSIHA